MAASWVVTADDGRAWRSRSLILTPPAPQSLTLLDAGGVELAPHERRALEAITYAPCLCAMLLVDGTVWLPAPGAPSSVHTTKSRGSLTTSAKASRRQRQC